MIIKTDGINAETFLKRAFYLAYNACGGTTGMGMLQARSNVTEDDVWQNVNGTGDYSIKTDNDIYGDYVFGRMMKWGGEIKKDGTIEIRGDADKEFPPDYHSFAHTFPTNRALLDATAKELDCKYEIIS